MRALQHQRKIYLDGAAGRYPVIPGTYEDLRAMAKRKLSHRAFTYIDGGAGAGRTIATNASAFNTIRIAPRMLRGIETVDAGTTVFGQHVQAPVIAAPVGVLELAHRRADIGVAQGCRMAQTPMMISSQASIPMERIAHAIDPVPAFYQLYWGKSDALARSFVSRAERCGCKAIVLTVDTTTLGWRTPDLDAAFIPFTYAMGIAQYTSDPVFRQLVELRESADSDSKPPVTLRSLYTLWTMAHHYPGSTMGNLLSGRAVRGVKTFTSLFSNPGLNWEHLRQLRDWTDLPIVVKGIMTADDARKACSIGANGIIVSNHGGRQVDGGASTLEMLNGIVDAVGSDADVVIDGGIRSGADVFKCLALGARAVMIGRPYAFALGVGGQKGVAQYFDNIISEFELTMLLAGCSSTGSISREFITQE